MNWEIFMDKSLPEKLRKIQNRVNEALKQSPQDLMQSDFSEYLPDNSRKIRDNFQAVAEGKGIGGIEAVLDEYDLLCKVEDKVRLQYSLMVFLANNPLFSDYGLSLPSLQERSSWKTLPSRKIGSSDENDYKK